MAWIESHQSLERHPKRADLSARMGWTKAETIGRLHMLWWWVLDFAEDGDLRKYNDAQIAEAMCVDIANASGLVEALVQARWLEREPYFRVRNWYSYIWRFLHARYGKTDIEKVRKIKTLYENAEVGAETGAVTALTNQPNQPTMGTRARVRARPVVPGEASESPPLGISGSERITFERSLRRVDSRLGELKGGDLLPKFQKEKDELKAEQKRLRTLLGIKV